MIKTHLDIGLSMLAGHPLVTEAVGKHHERPDYPFGLSGDQMPLEARIVGICDAFDAMTSHRPYLAGMPEQKALSILKAEAGHQFVPALVEVIMQLGQQEKLLPILGHRDNGIPLHSCPMCDSTLVISREQTVGERLYCHNCSGEFELILDSKNRVQATPTGRSGSDSDLEPHADIALISRVVHGIVGAPPLSGLLKQNHRHIHEHALL